MIQRIRTIPEDSILRQKAHKVKTQSKEYIDQVKVDLIETLEANSGAGLAAPQIGVGLRMIAFINNHKPIVLINPEIVMINDEVDIIPEGCLSIPGVVIPVERPTAIKVQHQQGNKWRVYKFLGHTARVVQHELDHLDGVLIVDKDASLKAPTKDSAFVI